MHLRQSGFYNLDLHIVPVNHLQKAKKYTKMKEIGDSRYIYQDGLAKVCLQYDMVEGDFKDLTRNKDF